MPVKRKNKNLHHIFSRKEINIDTFMQCQSLRLTLPNPWIHEGIDREFKFLSLYILEEWTWRMHPSGRSSQTTAPLLAPHRGGRGGQVMVCAHTGLESPSLSSIFCVLLSPTAHPRKSGQALPAAMTFQGTGQPVLPCEKGLQESQERSRSKQ